MIHLYCGDGKGKTTAAVGLAVRAAGSGLKVIFAQFMKGQKTGEITVLESIPSITVMRAAKSEKFTYQMTAEERTESEAENKALLDRAFAAFKDSGADLLVLDEAVSAIGSYIIDEDILQQYISEFPSDKELVITGNPPELWMIEAADYVTDMEKIKHPFDKGTDARKGIEF